MELATLLTSPTPLLLAVIPVVHAIVSKSFSQSVSQSVGCFFVCSFVCSFGLFVCSVHRAVNRLACLSVSPSVSWSDSWLVGLSVEPTQQVIVVLAQIATHT